MRAVVVVTVRIEIHKFAPAFNAAAISRAYVLLRR
jgi:hypothetical protein